MNRDLGRVEGKLDALIETVKQQGEKSDASRARQYERIEAVERNTHDLDGRMKTVEGTVQKMSPLVEEFGRIKQRGVGMLMLLGLVWLIIGGLVVQALQWVIGKLAQIGG
ncbi:DUF1515 family protein [Pelagibacterium lentulum]|nr:DUF1515 family protein [Pelagibacterium lentulum]